MDISKISSTDDLLQIIPPAENDEWEFKSSSILGDKEKLKAFLGKQVSAFANSGGGNLVIGISDETRAIESCDQKRGRQSTKDWLSTLVEDSVQYSIRHFAIIDIPVTNDLTKSIYVIAVEDSPAAPHQSKADHLYYSRIDGHSKPAQHFYLELLRSRMTSVLLEIVDVNLFSLDAPVLHFIDRNHRLQPRTTKLNLVFRIAVKNTSKHFAHAWGVRFSPSSDMAHWSHPEIGPVNTEGYLQSPPEQLLPGQTANLRLNLSTTILTQGDSERHDEDIRRRFKSLQLTLVPVSHNHEGNSAHFGCRKPGSWNQGLWENFVVELRNVASLNKDGTLEFLLGR